MGARYRQWVENLSWDWCISRQRYFGVTFPLWYCNVCGEIMLAEAGELPVDPTERQPTRPCSCGSTDFTPETDVMDTWATSSMSPQIAAYWLTDDTLYEQLFPMTLRPQAHEIIRTWAFYTIVKSHYHFGKLPWDTVAISGWGLAPEGMGKISKSRGSRVIAPLEMIERYSADAVRYWAASTGLGKDALINEGKIQTGNKLVTKLWNVARFSQRFLEGYRPPETIPASLTPADRWILARTQTLIKQATAQFRAYDYATAKSEIEGFFWTDLADNYLEMAKKRLYDGGEASDGACYALYHALLATIKLLAPILPHVTEAIYQGLFAGREGFTSIHRADWSQEIERLRDSAAEAFGETLVEIATAVRRYKSENNLSLGVELGRLQLATADAELAQGLKEAAEDLTSITRARAIEISPQLDGRLQKLLGNQLFEIAIGDR
jgi:valyl-tRNA synthetase